MFVFANYDNTALFIQLKGFKSKMGVFDKIFETLPISGFRRKILVSRLMFLVEIKRIRLNWCSRFDWLQQLHGNLQRSNPFEQPKQISTDFKKTNAPA